MGSNGSGRITQRNSQVTTLKMRRIVDGLTGLRSFRVSQEAILKAGWEL